MRISDWSSDVCSSDLKFNDTINGGNGTWHVGGTDNNWTNAAGSINAAYADGTFAIFAGTGGTVTVDNGSGAVTASGMQFASEIGRASGRERGCQYVEISVVAGTFKKKTKNKQKNEEK